jgi:hypothetical protein
VHLGPLRFLLLDDGLEEVVRGFRSLCGKLIGFSLLGNKAEVVFDGADDAGLFPRLAFRGVLGGRFVRLPAALGEHPAAAASRLDQKNVVFVGRKRHNAGDKPLALGAVTCARMESASRHQNREMFTCLV